MFTVRVQYSNSTMALAVQLQVVKSGGRLWLQHCVQHAFVDSHQKTAIHKALYRVWYAVDASKCRTPDFSTTCSTA